MTHHGQMKLEPEVPRRRRDLRTMDNVEGTVLDVVVKKFEEWETVCLVPGRPVDGSFKKFTSMISLSR